MLEFFITLTVNTADEQLTQRLFPGRKAEEDPIIVSQFFEYKLRAFLTLLKKGLLGPYVFSIVVVEWQVIDFLFFVDYSIMLFSQ